MRDKDGKKLLRVFRLKGTTWLVAAPTKRDAVNFLTAGVYDPQDGLYKKLVGIKGVGASGETRLL